MNPSNGGPPPITNFLIDPGWSEYTRRFLEQMVVQNPSSIAAFDFDDTLLDGDLSLALLNHRDPSGAAQRRYDQDCLGDTATAYAKLVETLLIGYTETEIRAEVRALFTSRQSEGTLRLRPALQELIWAMQRNNWTVYVVTASPAVVISPVAQYLGIPANHVLGMWCDTDPSGVFITPTRSPITYREGKVTALKSAIHDTKLMFAAGDTTTDLELLQHATHKLVVDRGVRALRAIATEKNWLIEHDL